MIIELFINPVTTTKKLVKLINRNWLIGISIGIPIIISLLLAFMAMTSAKALLNSVPIMSNLIDLGAEADLIIFISVFKGSLIWLSLILTLIYGIFSLIFKVKNIKNSALYIWKSIVVSSAQIIFSLLISTVFIFYYPYFIVISLIGVVNFIICLNSTLADVMLFGGERLSLNNSRGTLILASTNALDKVYIAPDLQKKKKMSSKKRILISSIAAVMLICVVLALAKKTLISKESVSKKLAQAIRDNNAKVIAQYIVLSDSRLKLDEETLSGYLTYIKDNPAYKSQLLAIIDAHGEAKNASSENLIKLTSSGKKFLLFDNYVYQLPAYFIKIQTDYKNTEVSINNKVSYTSVADNSTKECGPFLPGKYIIKGRLKTAYIEVKGEASTEVAPENTGFNIVNTLLKVVGQKISVKSEYKDAKIVINGKDTGITVDKIGDLVPLPKDESCKIQLQKEFPWGTMKTEEKVFGKDTLDFKFGENNADFLNTLSPAISEFMKAQVAADTNLDINKLMKSADSYITTEKNDIIFGESYGITLTGNTTAVTADLASLNLTNYAGKDNYYASVTVSLKGNFKQDGKPYLDKDSETMNLFYDTKQKKWVVEYMGPNGSDNMIKSPVVIKLK